MHKMARLAACSVLMLILMQALNVGPALASSTNDECDFGRDSLEITVGDRGIDVQIRGGRLYCQGDGSEYSISLSALKSITAEMDDVEDSFGILSIYLSDENDDLATWPALDTFDIDVTTELNVLGHHLEKGGANAMRVKVGPKSITFSGVTATVSAPSYFIEGGKFNDVIDGSTATAKLTVYGGDGDDLIKGGSGKDKLYGYHRFGTSVADGLDAIYGGPGNDTVDCGADADMDLARPEFEYGFGGDGDDYIVDCAVAGPGRGDDLIRDGENDSYVVVSYADLAQGVEFTQDASAAELITTGGAAGDDRFVGDGHVWGFSGSQGDDVVVDVQGFFYGDYGTVKLNAGDDVFKSGDADYGSLRALVVDGGAGDDTLLDIGSDASALFFGGSGNDVLRGRDGEDELYGGPGRDEAWGGQGEDACSAEIVNRCERIKGRNTR